MADETTEVRIAVAVAGSVDGRSVSWRKGQVVPVSSALADELVNAGRAERVESDPDPKPKRTRPRASSRRTATITPRETR